MESGTYQLEIEGAANGYVSFSVKDHPEYGDFAVTLTGEFCNSHGILTGAKITISDPE